jgi:hypothetical protein
MKRMSMMGLILAAVFAMSAMAAASASAAYPEFYECKKVTVKFSGIYNKGCVIEGKHNNELKENEYEKKPGIGKAATKLFKGKGGAATLHTPAVGGEVKCKAFKDEGKLTSQSTENGVISTFTGCISLGKKCTTVGFVAGTIKTHALKGSIGYINAAEHRVGVDLSPEVGTELAAFSCEGLEIAVSGSVVGEVTPLFVMSKSSVTTFTVNGGGFQTYKALEGQPEDVLESLVNGSGPFESGQQATATNVGELLELRA